MLVFKRPVSAKAAPASPAPTMQITLPTIEGEVLDASSFDPPASAREIQQRLSSLDVACVVEEVHSGPTLTSYYLRLSEGVRRRQLLSACDDIALALGLPHGSVRLADNVVGRGYVGLEMPNRSRTKVNLASLSNSAQFREMPGHLPLMLGLSATGHPTSLDLADAPHLLLAGTTGSGKSVLLNSLICSLLLARTWENLRLAIIDPKDVELSSYQAVPHTSDYASDVTDATDLMVSLLETMRARYEKLRALGLRSVYESTDAAFRRQNPPTVLVIDEYADLLAQNPAIERPLNMLAAKSRAAAIHIVLATQRPSVKVVTGNLKANFPTRITGRLPSKVDSRVVLDQNGAESLLGAGDMLLSRGGAITRFQSPLVTQNQIDSICSQWDVLVKSVREWSAGVRLAQSA